MYNSRTPQQMLEAPLGMAMREPQSLGRMAKEEARNALHLRQCFIDFVKVAEPLWTEMWAGTWLRMHASNPHFSQPLDEWIAHRRVKR